MAWATLSAVLTDGSLRAPDDESHDDPYRGSRTCLVASVSVQPDGVTSIIPASP
jgi:hypothetical protein